MPDNRITITISLLLAVVCAGQYYIIADRCGWAMHLAAIVAICASLAIACTTAGKKIRKR